MKQEIKKRFPVFCILKNCRYNLKQLSEQYSDDVILLCCDGAAWHKFGGLNIPNNALLFHIPPYVPEMNPMEQIWKELRKRGFHNEVFPALDKVVERYFWHLKICLTKG